MEQMNKKQIFEAIEKISSQNPLTKAETKTIITDSIKKIFNSRFDPDAELEVVIDEVAGVFKLYNNTKLVVSDDETPQNIIESAINIPLSKALKINPKAQVDDFVREEIDFALYSQKNIPQQVKQLITQTIRERKKEEIYTKYKDLAGEMIDVTVSSFGPTFVIFQLADKGIAFMPNKFRNPRIPLAIGQKTRVYVESVLEDSKDSQIIVSNGSTEIVKQVLEVEVPEIASGIVEIAAISRQPGVRSKVAVRSTSVDVDPVGTIIGAGGSRINAVIDKLEGEKVDVIPHSDDINIFIASALAPARVAAVCNKYDNDHNIIENQRLAIVPNTHLTLAIGKKGSNAKLAVELTKTRIDVISLEQAKEREINFSYNVGLTPQDAIDIDNDVRLTNSFTTRRPAAPKINNQEFDSTIASFKENITKAKVNEDGLAMDDNLFSDEKLREIESAFENDGDPYGANANVEDDENSK